MTTTDLIPVTDLVSPRTVFHWPDPASVEFMELTASIRSTGILTPLVVRRRGEVVEIIDGLSRFTVAKELGIESIPVKVVEAQPDEALLLAARLNADHRPPTEFVGHLRCYLRRNSELTIAGISQRLHKAPDWVIRCMAINYLDGDTLSMVERGEIPVQSGYFLAKLDRRREMFVDLARAMSAAQFKPIITAAIRESRDERRDHLIKRANPATFKPRTWLRSLDSVRAEHETAENGLRQVTGSALEGWRAAIAWTLNIDPAGIEKQKVNFEGKHQ